MPVGGGVFFGGGIWKKKSKKTPEPAHQSIDRTKESFSDINGVHGRHASHSSIQIYIYIYINIYKHFYCRFVVCFYVHV